MKKEGKIRHLALSNVSRAQVELALTRTPIVAVQNMYNVGGGSSQLARMTHSEVESPDDVLACCEEHGIAYLPFFPLGVGSLGRAHPALDASAKKHGVSTAQIALAWLLAKSKVMLPIPGTSSPEHVVQNWDARKVALTKGEVASIEREARAAGLALLFGRGGLRLGGRRVLGRHHRELDLFEQLLRLRDLLVRPLRLPGEAVLAALRRLRCPGDVELPAVQLRLVAAVFFSLPELDPRASVHDDSLYHDLAA
jgi:hypothetical protein